MKATQMRLLAGFTLLLASAVLAYGEAATVEDALNKCISDIRADHHKGILVEPLAREYGTQLLPYLMPYLADPEAEVRYWVQALLWVIGRNLPTNSSERMSIVDALVVGSADDRNLPEPPKIEWLDDFTTIDFSDKAKDVIGQGFSGDSPGIYFLAAGIAGMTNALPTMKNTCLLEYRRHTYRHYEAVPPWQLSSLYWATLSARARLGDEASIYEAINRLELSSTHIQNRASFLQRLAYIRQPQVVEHIWKQYLLSDEWDGGKGDVVRTFVAERAAKALSTMLVSFPTQQLTKESPFEYIVRCRLWMSRQDEFTLRR